MPVIMWWLDAKMECIWRWGAGVNIHGYDTWKLGREEKQRDGEEKQRDILERNRE